LTFTRESFSARVNALPLRHEIDAQVTEQLVVEFYAR
jgi:ribosomal protein S4